MNEENDCHIFCARPNFPCWWTKHVQIHV